MFAPDAEDWGNVVETSQNLCECDHDLSITSHDMHCEGSPTVPHSP